MSRAIRTLKMLKRVTLRNIPGYRFFAAHQMHKAWSRPDIERWPPVNSVSKSGLEKYEYSLFSQNNEDGLLRYLFEEIGFESKKFLEFGFGVTESNSLRLALVDAFGGVFIDGNKSAVNLFNYSAQRFGLERMRAIHKFLDLDNLNETVSRSGLPEDIDHLSIDVDGNDFWFWKGLTCIRPRVVTIEFNASFGPDRSITVPYDPAFNRFKKHESGFYCGASLTALERLGKHKGFALVGCDSSGVNAFFVREDDLGGNLKAVTPEAAYRPHRSRLERGFSVDVQYDLIRHLPFEEIPE